MSVLEAYDSLAEVLAKLDPKKILEIQASEHLSEQIETLVVKKKEGHISEEEKIELERYLSLDLLVNLTKAKAKKILVG